MALFLLFSMPLFLLFSSPYARLLVLGTNLVFSSLSGVLHHWYLVMMIFHVCNEIAGHAGNPANAGNPPLIAVLVVVVVGVTFWEAAVLGIWDTAATVSGAF